MAKFSYFDDRTPKYTNKVLLPCRQAPLTRVWTAAREQRGRDLQLESHSRGCSRNQGRASETGAPGWEGQEEHTSETVASPIARLTCFLAA
eukprot:767579-Hanusia_phi.AAC.13